MLWSIKLKSVRENLRDLNHCKRITKIAVDKKRTHHCRRKETN